jgi:rubrerythrin
MGPPDRPRVHVPVIFRFVRSRHVDRTDLDGREHRMRTLTRFVPVVLALLPAAAAAKSSTITTLQAAFEAELNASRTWKAYSRVAEREGFHDAARLLRALATADEVHAQNHAEALRALGGLPRAVVAEVEVKGTRANLEDAISREAFARDGAYPTWIATAREVGDVAPAGTLWLARLAERSHVELLQDALRQLDRPAGAEIALCVSPRSGHVAVCPTATAASR